MLRALALTTGLALTLPLALAAQRLQPPPPPGPRGKLSPSAAAAQKKVASPLFPTSTQKAPPTPDPLRAGHDLQVGVFYYRRGDYLGALSRFESAVYNDPAMAEAYCRAGDTESKLHRLTAARAEWQRCLAAAQKGKWAHHASKALAELKEHS